MGRSCSGLNRPKEKHTAFCGHWIEKLRRLGHRPVVHVLQEFVDETPDVNSVLNAAEIFWISELRRRGCPLTNCTAGGQGHPRPDAAERNRTRVWTPEMRERASEMRRGSKSPMWGRKQSEATKAKFRAARLGKPLRPEARARVAEMIRRTRKGIPRRPESILRQAVSHRGMKRPPGTGAKMAAARRGWKPTDAQRENMRNGWHRRKVRLQLEALLVEQRAARLRRRLRKPASDEIQLALITFVVVVSKVEPSLCCAGRHWAPMPTPAEVTAAQLSALKNDDCITVLEVPGKRSVRRNGAAQCQS